MYSILLTIPLYLLILHSFDFMIGSIFLESQINS